MQSLQKINTFVLAIVISSLISPFGFCSTGNNDNRTAVGKTANVKHDSPALKKLLDVQRRVQAVAAKNMEATVSISDGIGSGSGVIVNKDGLILTAAHVLASNREYQIIFPSGRQTKARALGKNKNVDAGMLQIIEDGPWPFAELGDSTSIKSGDWTVVLGHSGGWELGRKPPVRAGRVLKRRKNQFVTDGVLIGGDSGGPLFNLDGKVIGIHSSIGENVAENRHVTIATFNKSWDRMLASEKWGSLPELDGKPIPKIGVTVDHTANNARIIKVKANSPADKIGIKVNDVVVEFDNVRIRSSRQLVELIKRKETGDICTITVERAGGPHQFQIHLTESK